VYRHPTGYDGSVHEEEHQEGDPTAAGCGLAYRHGDGENTHFRINMLGTASSMAPEGAAILRALEMHPDKELTILTDSAGMMYALEACTNTIRWADFDQHPHRDMLQQIMEALQKRTPPLRLVKVKAHQGHYLNKGANLQANKGAKLAEAETTFHHHTL
jgi:ribonuclease HI